MLSPRIAIIGSGFSGLCLAIHLKREGFDQLTIFEKSDQIGGTWRDNIYPGAACDSPSFAYCFSFEQKTDWTRVWAEQPEILGYMQHCARKYQLLPHIRTRCAVESARFDEAKGLWRVRTEDGAEHEFEVLVSGVGQLNRPSIPELPGLARFQGACFHSAQWDPDVPLLGKRVAVVGNAASAVQFVPRVAKQASQLFVLQRSANWMLPKYDREYSEREKRRFANHPWLAKLYRWWIWGNFELRWPLFKRNRLLRRSVEKIALRELRKAVPDPELRRKLTPEYPVGGKRILISDDYYATLQAPNVELVTDGIDHFDERGVVLSGGRRLDVDVVILATGFESTSFLVPMQIEGLGGRVLASEWKDGASAYLGISTPGFPNFFMMYGPNTNLGHNSIIFMIECQTRYIMSCLRALRDENLQYLDLREDAMRAFNQQLQRDLARTVWNDTPRSWYKTADGRITNNWSGSTIRYWWKTRAADLHAYRRVAREAQGKS